MTAVILILAIGLGAIAEQSMPSSLLPGFARPPVLAGIVAYYALNHSAPMMLCAAFLGGTLIDAVCSLPQGISALVLAAAGTVLYHCRDMVISGKLVTNIVFGAAIGAGAPMLTSVLLIFFEREHYSFQPSILLFKVIASTLYGAVVFPVIYFCLERLERMTGVLDFCQDDTHTNN